MSDHGVVPLGIEENLPADQVVASQTEELVLFTHNEDLRRRLTTALTPPHFRWKTADLQPVDAEAFDANGFLGLLDASPTCVFVDSSYLTADTEAFHRLSVCKPTDLRKALGSESSVPRSIRVLKTIHEIRQNRGLRNLLIFFVVAQTPTVLSHSLLRLGADWLWSPRDDPGGVAEIIRSLRALQVESIGDDTKTPAVNRGRVFVAENSRNVCLALRTRLDRYFDLVFVGEDKPGNRFDISPDEALDTFKRGLETGGFVAAILDLALTDTAEDQAKQRFASDDAASRTFVEQNPRLIHEILGGVRLISELRRSAPNLRVFVFSNYVHVRNVGFIINSLVGRDVWTSVEPVGKNEKGYRRLKEELLGFAGSGTPASMIKGLE